VPLSWVVEVLDVIGDGDTELVVGNEVRPMIHYRLYQRSAVRAGEVWRIATTNLRADAEVTSCGAQRVRSLCGVVR